RQRRRPSHGRRRPAGTPSHRAAAGDHAEEGSPAGPWDESHRLFSSSCVSGEHTEVCPDGHLADGPGVPYQLRSATAPSTKRNPPLGNTSRRQESATCSRICSRTAHHYLDAAGQNNTIWTEPRTLYLQVRTVLARQAPYWRRATCPTFNPAGRVRDPGGP